MELPKFKLTHNDLAKIDPMLLTKLSKTPTAAAKAAHIRQVMSPLSDLKEKMGKEYQELAKSFGEQNEKGDLVREENKFGFKIKEGKETEAEEAIKAFDQVEVEISCRPLTPDALSDIKLTALEIELLGELFTESNGPGMPPF